MRISFIKTVKIVALSVCFSIFTTQYSFAVFMKDEIKDQDKELIEDQKLIIKNQEYMQAVNEELRELLNQSNSLHLREIKQLAELKTSQEMMANNLAQITDKLAKQLINQQKLIEQQDIMIQQQAQIIELFKKRNEVELEELRRRLQERE